ncbi:MAG: hypothetical protein D6775_01045 [Caldilineae bacterium]|nr:MAG: hypothetical protein D6775_01045 [Caldilineae bacterium]
MAPRRAQDKNPEKTQGTYQHSLASPRGSTVIYTYDAAGRLVGAGYGKGVRIAYTYDKAGNLLRREVVKPTPVVTPTPTSTPAATPVPLYLPLMIRS